MVALAASCGCAAGQASEPGTSARRDLLLPRESETIDARIPRNATLETVLRQNQVEAGLVAPLVDTVRRVFDPKSLRADQTYHLTRSLDGLFREFRYDIDASRFLRVVFRAHPAAGEPPFDASVIAYPREVSVDAMAAEISREQPSLTGAFSAAHQNVQLALAVADIFGGEVDFNSDLRTGDRIEVLFERIRQNGDLAGYGNVSAAVLTLGGRTLTAVLHLDADGKPGWYDEHGRSLKRQFLRSPLRLEPNPQVTSRFSYNRQNPVSGDFRAHLGVDYHASYGEPVVAVASGTVERAEWSGEAGRMVLLRHTGGYETAYLHLSAFGPGIRPGARVDQGQLIGRVGASGTATGPHLDYRIKKNGTYVNPTVELSRMPKGEPIAADALDAFLREKDRALEDLKARVAAAAAVDPRPLRR